MRIITPYRGEEAYIFISYAHRDIKKVQKIIYLLEEQGYRIWYDEGIDPGTEWDDNIASHIEACNGMIAFLSTAYIESDNCKDELKYARDIGKERLLVYLDDVVLSSGLAMRLNRTQAIYEYKYKSREKFLDKLFETDMLARCHDVKKSTRVKDVKKEFNDYMSVNNMQDDCNIEIKNSKLLNALNLFRNSKSSKIDGEKLKPTIECIEVEGNNLISVDSKTEIVILPDGIENISKKAFAKCYSLKKVYLCDTLKNIESLAFQDCIGLYRIKIPIGVKEIPSRCFENCINLREITLPNSIEYIGSYAFYGCYNLEKIIFNKSDDCKIEEDAFLYCKKIEKVMTVKYKFAAEKGGSVIK
jgi:hypothetical protein